MLTSCNFLKLISTFLRSTSFKSALERAATKDKDTNELMKSISDIQRTAQDREQEVHQLRKDAEDRALVSEKKVLLLNVENQSLERALDETKANCVTREDTIQELQNQVSDSKIDSAQFTSQLQLERDLRARSEEKEKEETLIQKHAEMKFTYKKLVDGLKQNKFKKIVVATGAGISVSAGIPDFRSPKTGLYANLQKYDLPDP